MTTLPFNPKLWLKNESSFPGNHFCGQSNTLVVYIKCFHKQSQEESSAPSSQNVPLKCKSLLMWFYFLVFRERFAGCYFWNIPPAAALHSYDGLVSHFLGQLGRHRALRGVRPLHVGHEQTHFLIGPSPLRVQLTVVPKRHLRERKRGFNEKWHFFPYLFSNIQRSP